MIWNAFKLAVGCALLYAVYWFATLPPSALR